MPLLSNVLSAPRLRPADSAGFSHSHTDAESLRRAENNVAVRGRGLDSQYGAYELRSVGQWPGVLCFMNSTTQVRPL